MNFLFPYKKAFRVLAKFCAAITVLFASAAHAAPTEFYASPNGSGTVCSYAAPCSLTGAQTTARAFLSSNASMTDNLIVYLRGGTYNLTSTFSLNQSDSGKSNFYVIYKNYDTEVPILNGGVQVTGWTLHDRRKNIYKAPANLTQFRQIYVNGARAIRARSPNVTNHETGGPYYQTSSSNPFTVRSNEVGNWQNLNQVETVWISHWLHKRTRIDSISRGITTAALTFLNPERSSGSLNKVPQTSTPYYFENAYEILDAPGEWYFSRAERMLYYKPTSSENMATAQVIVPQLETLVKISSPNGANPQAHHIQLEGLTFMHSNWNAPDNYGYLNDQAGSYLVTNGWAPIPGAVMLTNAANIVIKGNIFKFAGAHGLVMNRTLKNNQILYNTLTDLSAGGIYEFAEAYTATEKASYTLIRGNLVEKVGRYYSDGVGIFAGKSDHLTIEYNEVRQMPYSGISLGWDWTNNPTNATDNLVQYNLIHSVMQLHDDGGGVYSLGAMPNTMIRYNYISNIKRSPYAGEYAIAGVYLDNGSQYKNVYGNTLDQTDNAFYANNTPNLDNIFQNNYYKAALGTVRNSNTVQNNVQIGASASWPPEVAPIIAAAGIH